MEENISIVYKNPYTAYCNIGDARVKLVDRELREHYKGKIDEEIVDWDQIISKLCNGIGIVGMVFFITFLVGTIGHSDYCLQKNVYDTWTYHHYLLFTFFSSLGIVLSGIIIRESEKED